MKKIMMAALALASPTATPALAQSANWAVTGTVNAQCGALTGSTLAFGTIAINASDGKLATNAPVSSASQPVYCNGVNSTITVGYTAMTNTTTAATDTADFTGKIDYTANVAFGGTNFAPGAAPQALGASAGTLVVTASALNAGGKRPYAGSYSGNIAVTLSPAQ